eukprot:CAMPEP_0184287788 /NCGR_PEP_ID=MMETSP1049-20130417/188_1 /TAXON_ID=77928 /ORGANISM="Proteomonas sulcata, Strain CCMP704" /LENGTH=140 /DNA_ID=CAMNT_0026593857 /DNA_START=163 /DNA_END=585 /DNA_ORIENTATION=-
MMWIKSLLLLICVQMAMAFNVAGPSALPLAKSHRGALGTTCSLQGVADKAGKAAASAALALALTTGMPLQPVDASTVANPYAKSADIDSDKPKLTAEEREAKKGSAAVYVGGAVVASVALSYPFFKRSVERMGEKAQGKR